MDADGPRTDIPDRRGEATGVPRGDQLAVRAAWLYYIVGMTQAQIAKRFGINRVKVNRLLADAREAGIVQIRINAALADCVKLEEALRGRYACREAVVVPTPDDPSAVAGVIAVAAAGVLSARLREGMAIGVGWGRTLRLSLPSIERRSLRRLSVVSLLGGLTRGSVMNSYETASRLAELFGADCVYIAGPVFTDSEATRDVLMRQPPIADALLQARRVDLALVSVGALHARSTMVGLGLINREDIASLRRAGAVGDVCAHWIDAEGRLVDHPLNRRVLAVSPFDLRRGSIVLASGGDDKVSVLHGALVAGLCDTLVTDERTASALLDMPHIRGS
jgi:DNA-binding transcriptional regulator LsrR (DeoR family)